MLHAIDSAERAEGLNLNEFRDPTEGTGWDGGEAGSGYAIWMWS